MLQNMDARCDEMSVNSFSDARALAKRYLMNFPPPTQLQHALWNASVLRCILRAHPWHRADKVLIRPKIRWMEVSIHMPGRQTRYQSRSKGIYLGHRTRIGNDRCLCQEIAERQRNNQSIHHLSHETVCANFRFNFNWAGRQWFLTSSSLHMNCTA